MLLFEKDVTVKGKSGNLSLQFIIAGNNLQIIVNDQGRDLGRISRLSSKFQFANGLNRIKISKDKTSIAFSCFHGNRELGGFTISKNGAFVKNEDSQILFSSP